MPDWLLTIPRLLGTPVRWVRRRIRKHALDRQSLIREGSAVVTPVIQLAKSLGPGSIMWGTDDQNRDYLAERHTTWASARSDLMTYANQHPSDRIRALAHEVADAVDLDLRNTAWLLAARKTESTMDSFHASEEAHADALAKTERLMVEIRRY